MNDGTPTLSYMPARDDLQSNFLAGVSTDRPAAWYATAEMSVSTHEAHVAERERVRLTRRELEVLYFVANGCSSKQIADRLCLAKRTIDFHLANIYEKLAVSNRVQAFRAATRMGLVHADGPN